MNEKLMELLEVLKENEELQAKVKNAKNIDEVYAVTTQYVDGYTVKELEEGLKFIKVQISSDELSDEDLEMVAGGSKEGSRKKVQDLYVNTTWQDVGEALKDILTLGL